jgi:uncharacterized membrane protein YhiD involved in acid resistance
MKSGFIAWSIVDIVGLTGAAYHFFSGGVHILTAIFFMTVAMYARKALDEYND